MKRLIKLTVNDREIEIAVEPNMTLTDLIRYELGLTGIKRGAKPVIAGPVPFYSTACRSIPAWCWRFRPTAPRW